MRSDRKRATVSTFNDPEIWAKVEENLGLCGDIAKQFLGRGLDLDELVNEGAFGLYRAFELHDPKLSRISTFARWWIKQAIRNAFRNVSLIRVHPKFRKLAAKVHGGELDLDTVKVRPHTRNCILSAMTVAKGVFGSTGADGTSDVFATVEGPRPVAPMEADEEAAQLANALDRLPERDRLVIIARFGLDGQGRQTLKQIGDWMGIGRERVRQIEERALARLRDMIAS